MCSSCSRCTDAARRPPRWPPTRRLRELTAREFGQDPGPEAQVLLGQILADSPDLMFRPRPVAVSAYARPAWTPVRQLPAAAARLHRAGGSDRGARPADAGR